jgi:hypothetical protein
MRRRFERRQVLSTIALVGGIAAAAMFAVVLAISKDLSVAAVAASPMIAAVVAFAWAVVAHVRLGAAWRLADRTDLQSALGT